MSQPSTTAVCDPSFAWMDNASGQSPCQMASSCLSTCRNTPYSVVPITGSYFPPDGSVCSCNSVTYSLLSACATCQGGTAMSWDAWNAVGNCSSNDEQDFNGSFAPGVIPPVDIPEFYYTPIDGTWNVTAAFGAALSAESSSSATNFAATSVTSSLSSATSTSVSSTESTTSADSSSATDSLPPHTPTTAPSSAEIASSSIASSTSVPPISSPSLSVDGNGINGTPPAISSQSVTSSVSPSFASPPPPAANDSKPPPKHSSVGPIVGGVIGGIAGLAMIAILAIYLLRRNRRCQEGSSAVKVLSLGPDTMRFHDPEDSSTFLRYDWPTAGEHTDSGAFSSTKGSEGTVRLVPNRLVLL